MDYSGSGASSSSAIPREVSPTRRRTRSMSASEDRPPKRARGVRIEEPVVEEYEENELAMVVVDNPGPRPRGNYPRGPQLRPVVADWDGKELILDPPSHLSFRAINELPIGTMRTFSGYGPAFEVYRELDVETKGILSETAFGPLIRDWGEIANLNITASLVTMRAFLDRFWDTTVSLHMTRGYEAGMTVTGYAVMTGLPCGPQIMDLSIAGLDIYSDEIKELIGDSLVLPELNQADYDRVTLIPSKWVHTFLLGYGARPVAEVSPVHKARLWLWWFLGTTYFGDKGERLGTVLLYYLSDLDNLGSMNWTLSGLGLMIKYLRDSVRPDQNSKGSKPSLVGPGLIMESWIYSHFPSILPDHVVIPSTYPAVLGWARLDRGLVRTTYDKVRQKLNRMPMEGFIARPWDRYTGIPAGLLESTRLLDPLRLYLASPFGSYWYLGERLVRQSSRDRFVVPVDPPHVLFVQTSDPVVRRSYGDGQGVELLLEGADYGDFAMTRLFCDRIEPRDPDLGIEPSTFPVSASYEYGGHRYTLEVPDYTSVVSESGMFPWADRLVKVSGSAFKLLWKAANRWRNLAIEQMLRARKSEAKVVTLRAEVVSLRAEFDEYRRTHP